MKNSASWFIAQIFFCVVVIEAAVVDQTTITPESYVWMGNSSAEGNSLILTRSLPGQAGMVLYSVPQTVAMGFTIQFTVAITKDSPPCGDGWAFVIVPDGLPATVSSGANLGVVGLTNLVTYAFSQWEEEVFALCAAGPTTPLTLNGFCSGPIFSFSSDPAMCFIPEPIVHTLTYEYPNRWSATVNGQPSFLFASSEKGFLLDIHDQVKFLNNSKAFIGFTGSTGGVFIKQEITSWNFTSTVSCSINNGFCAANATCTQVSEDEISCACNDGFVGDGYTCTTLPTPMSTPTPVANNTPSVTNNPAALTSKAGGVSVALFGAIIAILVAMSV